MMCVQGQHLLIVLHMCMVVVIRGYSAGNMEHLFACSSQQVSLQCPGRRVLVFDSANFGRTDPEACVTYDHGENCVFHETIGKLNQLCFGRHACAFTVDTITFADACPGVPKNLDAKFRCVEKSDIYSMCDSGPITSREGYIISPGYPDRYDDDVKCARHVVTGDEYATIKALDIDSEKDPDHGCMDYVFVRSKVDDDQYLYCDDNLGNIRQSTQVLRSPEFVFETDTTNQNQYAYRGMVFKFSVGSKVTDFNNVDDARPQIIVNSFRGRHLADMPPARQLGSTRWIPGQNSALLLAAAVALVYWMSGRRILSTGMWFCRKR